MERSHRYGLYSSNFLTRLIFDKMRELLPSRIKRLFYIGSVIGVLFSKDPDPILLDRINEALKVAYGSNSMLFPAYFSDRIWANLMTEKTRFDDLKNLDANEKWRICLLFAHRCPEWLQYGTEQLMSSDVYEIILRASLRKAA